MRVGSDRCRRRCHDGGCRRWVQVQILGATTCGPSHVRILQRDRYSGDDRLMRTWGSMIKLERRFCIEGLTFDVHFRGTSEGSGNSVGVGLGRLLSVLMHVPTNQSRCTFAYSQYNRRFALLPIGSIGRTSAI